MNFRKITIAMLFVLVASTAWSQSKNTRNWQTGRLLSQEKTHELESTTSTTNTEGNIKSTSKGDKYSSQSTKTETQNYDDFEVYEIEAGGFHYTVKQRLPFPWSKPANIAIGSEFKYAIEKSKMYLLDDDGKENSGRIVKKAVAAAH